MPRDSRRRRVIDLVVDTPEVAAMAAVAVAVLMNVVFVMVFLSGGR